MEKVLVVETGRLAPYIAGRTGLITDNVDKLLDVIMAEHVFIDRSDAENDPSYKQVIPYVILTRAGQVFTTRRLSKGGEARLHGKISIGVGGHINPVDETDRQKVLLRGLERELDEETEIEHRGELVPCGVINDDSNAVGSVHLGLCFKMEVKGEVTVRETEKLEGGWLSMEQLEGERGNMESWTEIALAALR